MPSMTGKPDYVLKKEEERGWLLLEFMYKIGLLLPKIAGKTPVFSMV